MEIEAERIETRNEIQFYKWKYNQFYERDEEGMDLTDMLVLTHNS